MPTFARVGLVPPSPVERLTLARLVNVASRKLGIPTDRLWTMTIADIVLTLREFDGPEPATDRAGQVIQVIALCDRLELLGRLSREQRIELERWKADLT